MCTSRQNAQPRLYILHLLLCFYLSSLQNSCTKIPSSLTVSSACMNFVCLIKYSSTHTLWPLWYIYNWTITMQNTVSELFWASACFNVFFFASLPCCFKSCWAPREVIKLSVTQHALQKPWNGDISAVPPETAHCLYWPNRPWHVISLTLAPLGSVGANNKQPVYLRGHSKLQPYQQLLVVSQKGICLSQI